MVLQHVVLSGSESWRADAGCCTDHRCRPSSEVTSLYAYLPYHFLTSRLSRSCPLDFRGGICWLRGHLLARPSIFAIFSPLTRPQFCLFSTLRMCFDFRAKSFTGIFLLFHRFPRLMPVTDNELTRIPCSALQPIPRYCCVIYPTL